MSSKPGPVPNRRSQVRRRNKPEVPVDSAEGAEDVQIPRAHEDWHPIAVQWYESLALSGQRVYYEPSDWATAYLIAESMSRDLNPQFVAATEDGEVIRERVPLKGASLSGYLKAMTALLVTEGDRRRSRLELQRAQQVDADEEAAVAQLDEYRSRFSG